MESSKSPRKARSPFVATRVSGSRDFNAQRALPYGAGFRWRGAGVCRGDRRSQAISVNLSDSPTVCEVGAVEVGRR
jgi:hypothetical protein